MRLFTSILAGLVLATATVAKADSCKDATKSDLALQGRLIYTAILADAAKAGRLYPREAAVSGAHRFVSEFVARQAAPPVVLAAVNQCSAG